MDYLIENKINPPRFDLFSGEIWDTQFGYDVLQIVYEALQKGFKPGIIIIPSNFSFVLNDEALKIIDDYMQKITDCGVRLCWSCSNDGLYIDQMTRPFNNEEQYEACVELGLTNIYTDYQSSLMNISRLKSGKYDDHMIHNLGQINNNSTVSPYLNIVNSEAITLYKNLGANKIYLSYETKIEDLTQDVIVYCIKQ